MPLGGLISGLTSFAKTAAPFVTGLGAISTGGQARTLTRLAAGLGAVGGTEQGQRTAIDQPQQPASETAMSGESGPSITNVFTQLPTSGGIVPAMYNRPTPDMLTMRPPMRSNTMNGIQPAFFGGVAKFLFGGAAGALAPIIVDSVTGEQKKLRVTRKLKSQVKQAVEMFGLDFVAEQMGVDQEIVVYILTKKMRNDGPYVTKAAVRKTRQTVRKMKTLCDMYDDLRPAARRRAPARKTMSTRITNVK